MSFQGLDADYIVSVTKQLQRRIEERFPDSQLSVVCDELLSIAKDTKAHVTWVGRPILSLRIVSYILVGLIALGLISTILSLEMPRSGVHAIEFIQLLESGINDIVLVGAAVFFLVSIEGRIKRVRALKFIHELRSMAHLIDMHQLTKDPERLLGRGSKTKSSPEESMTAFELNRYLDYCSEMLSLLSKLAALYAQELSDSSILSAVNEVEVFTTGLSQRIWQKLMILNLHHKTAS